MKKIKKNGCSLLLSAVIILIASCNSPTSSGSSGGKFQGIVTYSFNLNGGASQPAAEMLKNMTITTWIKDNMSRQESSMAGSHTIMIMDAAKPYDPIMLMDFMGMKANVVLNDSLKKLAEKLKPDIQYLDSTKTIAGYVCKMAKVSIKMPRPGGADTTFPTSVYYTEDIPYVDPQGSFRGLKGFPMEFSLNQMGVGMKIEATSVVKQAVPDSLFIVPSGYQKMTMQELQQAMMSKLGGGGNATPNN